MFVGKDTNTSDLTEIFQRWSRFVAFKYQIITGWIDPGNNIPVGDNVEGLLGCPMCWKKSCEIDVNKSPQNQTRYTILIWPIPSRSYGWIK